ncbi:MAG: hypothetical protein U0931_06795 [Vulcanimicrobiota bacterium]
MIQTSSHYFGCHHMARLQSQYQLLSQARSLLTEASQLVADSVCLSGEARLDQDRHRFQQCQVAWLACLGSHGPSLDQPRELARGQQAQVGPHTMQVDGQGNISVETSPSWVSMGGLERGCSWQANYARAEAPLRFSNGTVELPNGQKRPYGNTGVIVVLADGRQFAAGRNSKDSQENIRYVAADKDQEIPVSPPGNTTVLYLDAGGNVQREETR